MAKSRSKRNKKRTSNAGWKNNRNKILQALNSPNDSPIVREVDIRLKLMSSIFAEEVKSYGFPDEIKVTVGPTALDEIVAELFVGLLMDELNVPFEIVEVNG